MFNWRTSSRLLSSLAGSLLFAPAITFAAQPNPPSQICVDAECIDSDPAPSASGGVKWHPGHYVWIGGSLKYNSSSIAAINSTIDSFCKDKNIKGVQIVPTWASLEGPSAGDYSSGFKFTDEVLVKLKSCNKHLMIHMQERGFGGPYSSAPSVDKLAEGFPRYLLTDPVYKGGVIYSPLGISWSGGLKTMARSWEQPVMDRLIALSRAYGQRYDSNPYFEMISVGETAVGLPSSTGFSYGSYVPQLKRWISANATAWPHTQVRIEANFIGSDSQFIELFQACAAAKNCSVGGPDPELPLPSISRKIQANRLFRAADGGGSDFRGTIAWVGETQALGLGDRITENPSDIFDYQYGVMRASYKVWLHNTWTGGDTQRWGTGIQPFISSISGRINTDCPSSFKNGCATR